MDMSDISFIKIIKNDSYIPRYIIAISIFIIVSLGIFFTGFSFQRFKGIIFVGKGFSSEMLIFLFMAFIVLILIIIRFIKILKIIIYGINCNGNICEMKLEDEDKGWEIGFSYSYEEKFYYNNTRLFMNKETQKFNIGDKIEVIFDSNDITECIVKDFYKK
jgi:hypothetical protein